MHKTPKFLFTALSIIFLFTSCNDDDLGPCANVMPACACGQLLLLDRWGSPLIGEDKMFHPDSIKMINGAERWDLRIEDSLVFFDYGLLTSNKEYYLYLSSSVQDTIQVSITSQPGECFIIKNISDFTYSEARVTIDDNKIVVIKI
ncbi:hypothetical protein [Owenweeksia hongkongensis]|uniref:hypothetical protein n=1 Tax=Owenweeksia hongkongensis TaxID=253245 RepID=UPI003A90ABD1